MNDTSLIECSNYLRVYFAQEYKQTSLVTQSCYGTATIVAIAMLPTIFLNALVIAAIFRSRTLRAPSFLLLCSLSFTDVFVGLVAEPRFIAIRIAELTGKIALYCKLAQLASVNGAIPICSLLMATAISVDRFLAIRLGVRYSTTVTKTRTRCVIVLLWVISVLLGAIGPQLSDYVYAGTLFLMYPTLVVTITTCYWKSFKALRRHRNQIAATRESKTSAIDLAKYEKVSRTMLWVVVLLFLCYAPFILALLVLVPVFGYTGETKFSTDIGMAIIYLNSLLNPVMYLIRVREIRRSCSKLLYKCNPFGQPVDYVETLSTTWQG